MSGSLGQKEQKQTSWAILQDEKAAKKRVEIKLWVPFLLLFPVYAYLGFLAYIKCMLVAVPIALLLFRKVTLRDKAITVLCGALILRCVFSVLLLLCLTMFAPYPMLQPPLTMGLPSHGAFSQRVHKFYSEHSDLDTILQSLKWQNFDIKYHDDTKRYHAAYRRNVPFFCMKEWNISWNIDDQGEVYDLKTYVGGACV